MEGPASLILDDYGFYAPVPILTLGAGGTVNDFNIALQVLFEPEAIPCRMGPAESWRRRVQGRAEGEFLPEPAELCAPRIEARSGRTASEQAAGEGSGRIPRSEPCGYFSECFGWTALTRSAVSRFDAQTGVERGTIFYWRITAMDQEAKFKESLDWEQQKHQIWESYAISYDRVLPVLPFYTEVVARHVAAMRRPGIESVLDMGAGTGSVSFGTLGGGRKVIALDLNRAMLNKLRAKLPSRGSAGLTIIEQNAEHLPQFKDGTMDGVSALLAFYDMADPRSALGEALRVLKPGGTIIATEPKKSFQLQPLFDFAEEHMKAKGLYQELKADWDRVMSANRALDPVARKSSLRAETLYETLCDASFEDVEMEDSHLGNCATVSGRKTR